MKPVLRAALQRELDQARAQEAARALDAAFAHLERAHILSQRHAFAHADRFANENARPFGHAGLRRHPRSRARRLRR